MGKTALIIFAQGFEEIEAITPIDLLRRAGIEVSVEGLDSVEVKGSHDIQITADAVFTLPSYLPDAVILPGGPGHKNLLDSKTVIEFAQKMFMNGKLCATICAAPSVLGKAGILKGKKVTCFPGFEDKLEGGIFVKQPVVIDGTIITSRGAGTAVPFSLEIIRYLTDTRTVEKVASAIVYPYGVPSCGGS
jgi:4-methyl-5(b-hydroxyethyl)-thiazole monophosphate biosynthesis